MPHSYVQPEPAVPPAAVSVVELPLHIIEVPVMLVGAVGAVLTVAVCVAEFSVAHKPLVTCAR